jgi:hypothetical protein
MFRETSCSRSQQPRSDWDQSKGGVGKTTLAANICYEIAEIAKTDVLLIERRSLQLFVAFFAARFLIDLRGVFAEALNAAAFGTLIFDTLGFSTSCLMVLTLPSARTTMVFSRCSMEPSKFPETLFCW